MTDTDVRRLELTYTQSVFWHCTARYQDLEGAVRSGKTTVALAKVGHRCLAYPGLHAMISRWQQSDTDAQLKARFKELFGERCTWNATEEYFQFPNTSRVYVRGLKPAEGASMFSKFAGLTLAIIYLDQPEEIPHQFFEALKARLSQPGMPAELYLTPNPPDEDHWLAEEFPLSDSDASYEECRPEHTYIRTTVFDNQQHLPPSFIPQLEAAYGPGHVLRRRFIEGRRGLSVEGEPVYKHYFDRARHVVREPRPWMGTTSRLFDPAVPLYESWDFGHSSPCVSWHQLQNGGARWVTLGAVQGRDLFLEDFAPMVLAIRQQWFPIPDPDERRWNNPDDSPTVIAFRRERARDLAVESTGDPAGATNNSQGTNRSAVTVLRGMGVHVLTMPDANHPERRNYAIQVAAGYMERTLPDGRSCFQISDRFLKLSKDKGAQEKSLLVDGFEAGYVWDKLSLARTASPNTRRPKKDGVFDHGQNTVEYAVLRWAPGAPAALAGVYHTASEKLRATQQQERDASRALRRSQLDPDEPFRWSHERTPRGGACVATDRVLSLGRRGGMPHRRGGY